MVIVKACFDESGTSKDQEHVVFAGCVAGESEWNVISDKWKAALAENDIRYLTMKEAFNFKGEFKGWRNRVAERDRLLVHLAATAHPLIAFYLSAPMVSRDFWSLPDKERAKLRDPQYCGFEGCVRYTLDGIKDPRIGVHIYCDSSDAYARQCLELYIKLRRENLDVRERCIAITFAEDEHFPPLQMADMLAYCVRHSQPDSTPEPVIKTLNEIFEKDGIGISGMTYKSDGPGLGRGRIEPMRIRKNR
jgi:hypothetical protein